MTHPFRELAVVIPDKEPAPFSPEEARDILQKSKPQRDKKKERETEKTTREA